MSDNIDTTVDERSDAAEASHALRVGPRLIHTLFSASKNVLVYELSNRAAQPQRA